MNRQLEVEAIFGEMGLPSILAGKPRLSKGMLGAAGGRELTIRRKLLQFLSKDAWDPAVEMVEIDYDTLLPQLSAGKLSTAQTQPVFAVVPDPEMAQAVCELADQVIAWAAPLIPRGDADPITGQVEDPPRDALLDFRRLYGVAIDPMAILADLGDGSMADDQVAVMVQIYPAHLAAMRAMEHEATATMVARKGKGWSPSSTKASLIMSLRGQPSTDPAVVVAMQQIYAAQELAEMQATPAPPKARRASGPDSGAEGTPGEKAANG